jgi:hypothetical protein
MGVWMMVAYHGVYIDALDRIRDQWSAVQTPEQHSSHLSHASLDPARSDRFAPWPGSGRRRARQVRPGQARELSIACKGLPSGEMYL